MVFLFACRFALVAPILIVLPISLALKSGSIVSALTTPRAKKSISEFDTGMEDAWNDDVDDDVAAVAKSFKKFALPEPTTPKRPGMEF